ncbi:MAG: DUF86 domain-containing protein [Halobacteriales archaeon]|nr:DUF86 domain-containing protein [Halobacteriales archaeon]
MADRDRKSLQDVVDHANLAMDYLKGIDEAKLLRNRKLQLAVERLVEIVGEAAGRVSPATQATLAVDWRGLRSLRNVVSHQYDFVDHRRLLHFITHLFPATVAAIEAFLEAS